MHSMKPLAVFACRIQTAAKSVQGQSRHFDRRPVTSDYPNNRTSPVSAATSQKGQIRKLSLLFDHPVPARSGMKLQSGEVRIGLALPARRSVSAESLECDNQPPYSDAQQPNPTADRNNGSDQQRYLEEHAFHAAAILEEKSRQ
jgi:hypothetical protein